MFSCPEACSGRERTLPVPYAPQKGSRPLVVQVVDGFGMGRWQKKGNVGKRDVVQFVDFRMSLQVDGVVNPKTRAMSAIYISSSNIKTAAILLLSLKTSLRVDPLHFCCTFLFHGHSFTFTHSRGDLPGLSRSCGRQIRSVAKNLTN